MIIKEMFKKPIDRDIKGVIKVGQSDSENVRQELEEYVVTRELQTHFADFFGAYKKGITGHTDKMGVWISGFFGSGKSHFLKILSYLLSNREVDGKRALDYFTDDHKIADALVLADMNLAADRANHTDIVLFNIDSKSEMAGKQSKDAIVAVFLKVFNELQGFCASIPFLADLERTLTEDGLYEDFKAKFEKNFGKSWISSRHKFDFIQDSVVEVLEEMNFMTEAAARNWCERAAEPYSISIESFAKLVKDYLAHKGNDHHIVFLVDEIGQYIGDDSKLMLNLQTVTEDLGTACQGKAWVVVTSQQDIDSITKGMQDRSNDFSKIQGRFDTRLSLSSANVDEAIKKRILAKTPTAEQTLKLLYEQKATIIKNLMVFSGGDDKKLYANEGDFAAVYPFVPYQFNLLGVVLSSIRTHGASGKHLSEGERSMIALFKESAMKLMEQDVGELIPFNVFYDALHQFLDHSHKGVISKATDNDVINPERSKDCFAVNVLKTLFMIKYVKEIEANIDNITSLMIDQIDADRASLKKQVEAALTVLVSQTLVQKNGNIYVFLTDEEQEINREINGQNIEIAELISKVSELIFDDIFTEKKYRYPEFNGRYNFAFNQNVDDRQYRVNQNHDIGVKVLTPYYDYGGEEATLRMISGQENVVLLVLPPDFTFIEELKSALKIEKYLRLNSGSSLAKFEQIKQAKREEMQKRRELARLFLVEALKAADIYVNGDKGKIAAKEVNSRMTDALSLLVRKVYHKLSYITAAMSEANIRNMLQKKPQQELSLDGEGTPNELALQDVLNFISANSTAHTKTSMKSLMDRFMKAPYGFVEDDVEWLVARLFKTGDISLMVNGSNVTNLEHNEDQIIRYITKREYVDKLMTERREKASEQQKKVIREIMKELFGASTTQEEDDAILASFKRFSQDMISDLDKYDIMQKNNLILPGAKVISSGRQILRSLSQLNSTTTFFQNIQAQRNDLLDFAEDYEYVRAFYEGEQKRIFEEVAQMIKIYDDSKNFVVEPEVETKAEEIRVILTQAVPYGDIPKLPEMLDKFRSAYNQVLDSMEAPVIEAIKDDEERVKLDLRGKAYEKTYEERIFKTFAALLDKAKACNNVATLQNIKLEADAVKMRLLDEFRHEEEKLAQVRLVDDQNTYGDEKTSSAPATIKKPKYISIRTVNLANSWQIESVEDVDRYLTTLRKNILETLDGDTMVHIEF